MPNISPDVLQKLRGFDTPTICNVIELFSARPRNTGYMDQRIVACFPDLPAIVGFAATATFRSAAPTASGDAYVGIQLQIERFAELSGPPLVVFQDLDNPSAAATFGEIMCSSYQAFGAVGLVTSGTGRDLDQVRALGFPVFTNGTVCAHGYCHTPDVHVPVHVGGITIYPDDLLHADRNGVTTIPKAIAAEVAEVSAEFVAAEAVVLDLVKRGRPTLKEFNEARAEQSRRVKDLVERVSRTRR